MHRLFRLQAVIGVCVLCSSIDFARGGCYEINRCCLGRNLSCASVETSGNDETLMPDFNAIEMMTLSNDDEESPLRGRRTKRQPKENISPRTNRSKFGRRKKSKHNGRNSQRIVNDGFRPVYFEPELEREDKSDEHLQVSHFGLTDDYGDNGGGGKDNVEYNGVDKEIRYVIVGDNSNGRVLSHLTHRYKNFGETCYCDEMCRPKTDCCSDYNDVCPGVDCSVSEWSSWTKCKGQEAPMNSCGPGVKRRFRSIITKNQNGGIVCPHLSDEKPCFNVDNCNPQSNVALLLPYKFAEARYTARKFYYDLPLNYKSKHQTSCVLFRTSWFNNCKDIKTRSVFEKAGADVCVECQPVAYLPHKNGLCPGEGNPNDTKPTYWSLINAKTCFGEWIRLEKRTNCNCQAMYSSFSRFIFV